MFSFSILLHFPKEIKSAKVSFHSKKRICYVLITSWTLYIHYVITMTSWHWSISIFSLSWAWLHLPSRFPNRWVISSGHPLNLNKGIQVKNMSRFKWKLTKNEPILYLSGFIKVKSNVGELKYLFQYVIMEFI